MKFKIGEEVAVVVKRTPVRARVAGFRKFLFWKFYYVTYKVYMWDEDYTRILYETMRAVWVRESKVFEIIKKDE